MRRVKCFARKVQHHRRIFTHRIEHYWLVSLGDHFAHDVDAFGLQAFKMGKRANHRGPVGAIAADGSSSSIQLRPLGRSISRQVARNWPSANFLGNMESRFSASAPSAKAMGCANNLLRTMLNFGLCGCSARSLGGAAGCERNCLQ